MASSDSSSSHAPAALAAFLRGCERRGAVFAELQCGDAERGDVALAAALRAFRAKAAALPMADWPVRFWSLLAATPQLRADGPNARWPGDFSALASSAPADRSALLLRLAGGLQEAEAAGVLGLEGAAYRDALARACPRDTLGHPDAAGWRTLAEAIQQHLRELPADRLATLARLREEALAGIRLPPREATAIPAVAGETPRRGRWVPMAVVVLLVALAAAAAFWWWRSSSLPSATTQVAAPADDDGVQALPPDPVITVDELPPAGSPAAHADTAAPPASDPDAALLADADEPRAREADFLAWYVATGSAAQAPAAEVADADR